MQAFKIACAVGQLARQIEHRRRIGLGLLDRVSHDLKRLSHRIGTASGAIGAFGNAVGRDRLPIDRIGDFLRDGGDVTTVLPVPLIPSTARCVVS